jgi:ATP-dependent DNA helicase RecQ
MLSPLSTLQKYWHYSTFRPQQEAIIQSVLDGKDTLALLPTGGGKSICYQVPALMLEGLCLVVSPLIALMKDQVANLEKRGIAAAALHSGMSYYEVIKTLQDATAGKYTFLYVSPERLQTEVFTEFLGEMSISIIAVDEAHCISQWGYDFRPAYLRIAQLREVLPHVPMLAVTASATPLVEKDIIEKLEFENYTVSRQSFERPNVSFSVFNADSKINKLIEILNNVPGSSIVYCRNRKTTKQVAQLLSLQGISSDYYHAGLPQEERSTKQDAWINNTTRVIVCTNAFGMGIDKPDVRTVIHYEVPDCLESYYQEAGRVGRDSKKAYAVLLVHSEDITTLEALPDVRFPSVYDIKKVYQALADFLKIPVGIGEGSYYDFNLGEFVKNFNLNLFLVINVLKVLEQEGHLAFNENIFIPSQICFTVPKTMLHDFEESHPNLEPVMKCLLRTYEGIYDNKVSINENYIAKLTRLPVDKIRNDLHQLNALNVIEYLPQKETPQIHFVLNRAPAEFLYINTRAYLHRKKLFEERTKAILAYMQPGIECRASYIAKYFGDATAKNCGICDNCLARKNKGVSRDEFNDIAQRVLSAINGANITVKAVLLQLQDIGKEKSWEVLEYLQKERKIVIDGVGRISKNK